MGTSYLYRPSHRTWMNTTQTATRCWFCLIYQLSKNSVCCYLFFMTILCSVCPWSVVTFTLFSLPLPKSIAFCDVPRSSIAMIFTGYIDNCLIYRFMVSICWKRTLKPFINRVKLQIELNTATTDVYMSKQHISNQLWDTIFRMVMYFVMVFHNLPFVLS